MGRLLAIVAIFGVLGILAPQFAPGLLVGFVEDRKTEPGAAGPEIVEKAVELPLSPRQVALTADARGHFSTSVFVNGRRIDVMVDTGATAVSLNEATAASLGIRPARSEFTLPMSTANGIIKAAPVTLGEIRVGDIRLTGVQAIVVPGTALGGNLLGMSFLSRLSSFEVTRDRLVLVD